MGGIPLCVLSYEAVVAGAWPAGGPWRFAPWYQERGPRKAPPSGNLATTSLDNTGVVEVAGGTLGVSAAVTQVAGSALTAGTWTAEGSATVHSKLDITSAGRLTTLGSAAAVTLSGLNTTFTNLRGLTTIDAGASFSLLGSQSFTTLRALRNEGSITLGPGSVLTVNGNFTQTAAGTVTTQLGGTDAAPTFGQLVSTIGTVTSAGNLNVISSAVPAVGTSFEILDNEGNATIGGGFSGLPEGSTFTVKNGTTTMTFQITYAGTDDDGNQNVILTRVS
jgi:autotransporter family porin